VRRLLKPGDIATETGRCLGLGNGQMLGVGKRFVGGQEEVGPHVDFLTGFQGMARLARVSHVVQGGLDPFLSSLP